MREIVGCIGGATEITWRNRIGKRITGISRNVQLTHHSTLMYIEAEAKMDSFQAQDGSQRTALNLLQRKFCGASEINRTSLTLRQVILRHSQDRASRTAARPVVPRATPTLPASLSAALVRLEERHAGCKKVYDNIKTGLDKLGVGGLFGGHGGCRSSIVFCLYPTLTLSFV
jgi:hypothetical protein